MDFSKLDFGYRKAPYRFVAKYKDGKWDEGQLTDNEMITVNECACVFQYAQTCFEGLKAYRTVNDDIVCFRPDLNAARMADTCQRMVMPVFPEDKFLAALKDVIVANAELVPPYGTGASLYVRPFMMGTNACLGVRPATEFEFRIFVSPVGAYFNNGIKPLKLRITDYDRAAPHGTGHIKAALNYAMSLYPITDAHNNGFDENVYLDAGSHTYLEETGGANILFVTPEHKVVTPKSESILPSITKRSLLFLASEYLGLEVEERRISVPELASFAECGLCGTAAVISPVGKIVDHDREYVFGNGTKPGEITLKMLQTLQDIRLGLITAPKDWIFEIKKSGNK